MAEEFQVGCNLTKKEAKDLDKYARENELSRPKLCALLVLRELAVGQLERLKALHRGSEPKEGAARVTARVSAGTKKKFEEHVRGFGIGSNDGAAVLFRAELQEQWLKGALADQGGNRP